MTQTQIAVRSNEEGPAWGKANEKRGHNYHPLALQFLKEFPIGTVLSPEQFDSWAQHKGQLNVPEKAQKKSDAWLAHLQRRHQLRYNINKAGTHPRMYESGSIAFTIDGAGPGTWEVRAPHTAIGQHELPARIVSLTKTKRRQLAYLMQSADWSVLPPHERMIAEALYDDIDTFEKVVDLQSQQLTMKFEKLEGKIRRAMAQGQLQSTNGGISGLLESPEE